MYPGVMSGGCFGQGYVITSIKLFIFRSDLKLYRASGGKSRLVDWRQGVCCSLSIIMELLSPIRIRFHATIWARVLDDVVWVPRDTLTKLCAHAVVPLVEVFALIFAMIIDPLCSILRMLKALYRDARNLTSNYSNPSANALTRLARNGHQQDGCSQPVLMNIVRQLKNVITVKLGHNIVHEGVNFLRLNDFVYCVAQAPEHEDQVREESDLLEVFSQTDDVCNFLNFVHVIFVDLSDVWMVQELVDGPQMLLCTFLLVLIALLQFLVAFLGRIGKLLGRFL